MVLVVWNDRFSTGIPTVDDQHKTLFATVNEFHEGLVAGRAKDQLAVTLASLVDYTVKHFQAEEDFMKRHGFDGLPGHAGEHRLLLEEVSTFKAKWTQDPASVRPMEVARFLGDWLTHHIQQMDFQYAKFLKDKGITV